MFQQRVIADRYELTTPIGQGGMGTVVRGYDRRLDRRIAVKMMRRDQLDETATRAEALVQRFLRETKMTARVEHPGIPAVYDAGTENDEVYLVMQFVSGQELRGLLAGESALPVASAAAVSAQLASILAAAHANFLVHRDIKPENVMVGADGSVKLLDFGIAILLDPRVSRLTGHYEMVGSAPYTAPELWRGEDITTRVDLYALGCVLFETLTGRPPFTGSHPANFVHQHLNTAPPALETLREGIPQPLDTLVTDLLAKDPADRPADASEVLTRLGPYLPAPQPPGARDTDADHDPTHPFRHPFSPRQRANRGDTAVLATPPTATPTPTTPEPEPEATEPPDPDALRDEVDRLVGEQRFTQAADVLSAALSHEDGLTDSLQLQFAHMRADAWFSARRINQACEEYQRLLPLLTDRFGEGSEDVLDCRHALAACLVELERHAQALDVMLVLLDGYRVRGVEDSEEALELRFGIVRSRALTGDVAAALSELRALHDDAVETLGSDSALVGKLRRFLHRLERS